MKVPSIKHSIISFKWTKLKSTVLLIIRLKLPSIEKIRWNFGPFWLSLTEGNVDFNILCLKLPSSENFVHWKYYRFLHSASETTDNWKVMAWKYRRFPLVTWVKLPSILTHWLKLLLILTFRDCSYRRQKNVIWNVGVLSLVPTVNYSF